MRSTFNPAKDDHGDLIEKLRAGGVPVGNRASDREEDLATSPGRGIPSGWPEAGPALGPVERQRFCPKLASPRRGRGGARHCLLLGVSTNRAILRYGDKCAIADGGTISDPLASRNPGKTAGRHATFLSDLCCFLFRNIAEYAGLPLDNTTLDRMTRTSQEKPIGL